MTTAELVTQTKRVPIGAVVWIRKPLLKSTDPTILRHSIGEGQGRDGPDGETLVGGAAYRRRRRGTSNRSGSGTWGWGRTDGAHRHTKRFGLQWRPQRSRPICGNGQMAAGRQRTNCLASRGQRNLWLSFFWESTNHERPHNCTSFSTRTPSNLPFSTDNSSPISSFKSQVTTTVGNMR